MKRPMRPFRLWCVICQHEGSDVAVSVACYADGRYQSIPRCRNKSACRQRVLAQGLAWPLDERIVR